MKTKGTLLSDRYSGLLSKTPPNLTLAMQKLPNLCMAGIRPFLSDFMYFYIYRTNDYFFFVLKIISKQMCALVHCDYRWKISFWVCRILNSSFYWTNNFDDLKITTEAGMLNICYLKKRFKNPFKCNILIIKRW